MFDCVIPTRSGRRGQVFTAHGPLNLNNARFKDDFTPIEGECDCYACRTHTRAYLRHLFQAREILAMRLASLHNLRFYHRLVLAMQEAIAAGEFASWLANFQKEYLIKNEIDNTQ
jgi:queuine tRNA-ribosyltransferase